MREFINLVETFLTAIRPTYRTNNDAVEVYRNPSAKEWRSMGDSVHAFIIGDDILAWQGGSLLHYEVHQNCSLPQTAIPVYLYGDLKDDLDVQVTDSAKRSPWFHNPLTANQIRRCNYLKNNFSDISVSYFDEAIVGDWEELQQDDDQY